MTGWEKSDELQTKERRVVREGEGDSQKRELCKNCLPRMGIVLGRFFGWVEDEVVKTRLGRGDQLAGRPMDWLSLGRPSYPSGEQRVARPYRSGDQTAGQNSARRSRRDRPT